MLGWSCPVWAQTVQIVHQYGTVDGLGGTVEDLFGLPILAGQGLLMLPMGGQAYKLCLTDENAPIVEGTDMQTTVMNSAVACLDMEVHQSFLFERFDDFFLAASVDVVDSSHTHTIAATVYATQRDGSGQVIGNPFPVETAGYMQTIDLTIDTQDFGMLVVETTTFAMLDSFSSIHDAIAAARWLSVLAPTGGASGTPIKPGFKARPLIATIDGNQTAGATQAPGAPNAKGIACTATGIACIGKADSDAWNAFLSCAGIKGGSLAIGELLLVKIGDILNKCKGLIIYGALACAAIGIGIVIGIGVICWRASRTSLKASPRISERGCVVDRWRAGSVGVVTHPQVV